MKPNYSEIRYLQRANKVNIDNIVDIDIDKKYTIICNGVKRTSNAKKTTSHKLETQISRYSDAIGDCSINAKLKKRIDKESYMIKKRASRKKLKAKA